MPSDIPKPQDVCSLCGRTRDKVGRLVVGLQGAICESCHALVGDVLSHEPNGGEALAEVRRSALDRLRDEVCRTNQMLPKCGLVTMHSGNASGYDPESGIVVIKPSGMDYDKLTPGKLVAVSLETGEPIDSKLRPSVDLPHHLFLYRNLPDVRGIIHTHSNHATAFAACGKPVPVVLTAIADEFGCEIPCMPYTDNEGDHIGQAILKHMNRAPAILLGNHGVFAWGASPTAALKAAVMTEDVAKTVLLAMQLGHPTEIPSEEVEKWYDRYHHRYGQS